MSKALSAGFWIVTLAAAAGAFAVGVHHGTFAASDTDPYGYVSEAELIARGTLRVDQQFSLTLPFRDAEAAFIPAGYKRAPVPGYIVPIFPPGLPLVMAASIRIAGTREAVFYAVPLLGAVLVCLTALLGTRIHSRLAGVSAAVLVATSPSFVYQVTQPVSDIPAAAWWTLSLLLTLYPSRWAAAGAGAAASMGVLTRPNLVVLVPVLGGFYLWRILQQTTAERRAGTIRLLLFVAGFLPGCLALAAWNQYLFGGPLRSGYPPINELYAWAQIVPNLDRYPRWLLEAQTPFIYLGLASPWLMPGRRAYAWLCLAWAAMVFLPYLPYGVFGREDWTYLRFLLPAFPALLVLSVGVSVEALRRVTTRGAIAAAVWIACLAGLAVWQARESRQRGAFVTRLVEQRYVDVGRYVAGMSPDAVFIAALHAGSIRYYGGQLTIYYHTLHPRALEQAVAEFNRMGRRAYVVLDEGEEARFRWHFDTYTALGRLDWPPAAQIRQPVPVRIYDLADRERFVAGDPVVTYDIALKEKPIVTRKGLGADAPR